MTRARKAPDRFADYESDVVSDVWTHELGEPKLIGQPRVVDSQGVDLGLVLRCNIKTGDYVPASGIYSGQTLTADAPLQVVFE